MSSEPRIEDSLDEEAAPVGGMTIAALVGAIDAMVAINRLDPLKTAAMELRDSLGPIHASCSDDGASAPPAVLSRRALFQSIDQILAAQTVDRAVYYLKRLKRSLVETKHNRINDLNLRRWQELDEIVTDSLWIVEKRDTSGAHSAAYWGNFIPQIPRQMLMRYTRRNDWVLDAFVGGGTTLIECRRLGRNGIGVELNPEAASDARSAIESEPNACNVVTEVVQGDSRAIDLSPVLARHDVRHVQLAILHPPYHDIVKFSEDARDLSNAPSLETFLDGFGRVVDTADRWLEPGRYLVLVIGDKYSEGEWIPLGFHAMSELLKRRYRLKSIGVKNYERTRGKRANHALWRYRALAGGFFVFKHEYIMIFQKPV